MSSTTPGRPVMDPSLRRGSWARALDRVRAVVKRRGSSVTTLSHTAPLGQEATSAERTALKAVVPAPTLASRSPEQHQSIAVTPHPASTEPSDSPLDFIVVDTEHHAEPDDLDEALLPIYSTRTSISDEKAKMLFARYGMPYVPRSRRPQYEPPNKIRRVEKAVRLRVHWTCHHCHMQYGIETACTACGHRRCRDCHRHPPKGGRDVLDIARRQTGRSEMDHLQTDISASAIPTAETTTPFTLDSVPQHCRQEPFVSKESSRVKSLPRPQSHLEHVNSQPLEIDDAVEDEEASTLSPLVFTRPRSAMIFKANARMSRRTCHMCEGLLGSAHGTECVNCGHEWCERCPKTSFNRNDWSKNATTAGPDQPVMIRQVERVYRKPRQRVRYTCEHCSTLFVDTDRCNECGHERCSTCYREPPKRLPLRTDPEIFQVISTRIANYAADSSHLTSISASAG